MNPAMNPVGLIIKIYTEFHHVYVYSYHSVLRYHHLCLLIGLCVSCLRLLVRG